MTYRVVSCLLYVKASEETDVNRFRERSLKYSVTDIMHIMIVMMIFRHNMMIMIIITKGSYIRLRLGAPLKANGGISSIRFRSSRLGNKNHDDDDDDGHKI